MVQVPIQQLARIEGRCDEIDHLGLKTKKLERNQ